MLRFLLCGIPELLLGEDPNPSMRAASFVVCDSSAFSGGKVAVKVSPPRFTAVASLVNSFTCAPPTLPAFPSRCCEWEMLVGKGIWGAYGVLTSKMLKAGLSSSSMLEWEY
ncbi:hypothetical protein TraAM80_01175 [Trypanosoma rangeli]|uniref:Uncharacterized protein n=1 Tax=Trypanosoma rangeli TaxID=5698 RepID=A0A3R7KWG1_TRYRA|nr:uncharacterized protein TraAM80_01175 [Trypanosoma rangeli]RNF11048.1 hypothetical protein TraAM80_01175 [Trypanosoma rangeli]|eukprot:RNF11048.1 hypothetical protein TraAM80_01175 [Trypanosoma rangeli]